MGEAAIQHCRSYAFEAERKMGQMLLETDKSKGARAGGKKTGPRGRYTRPREKSTTLAELGISKDESADAQMLAKLPKAESEKLKAGKKSKAKVKTEHKAAKN